MPKNQRSPWGSSSKTPAEPESSQSSRAEEDDPVDDLGPSDTVVDLELEDLREFDQDATTPPTSPTLLPGYELGRRDERIEMLDNWADLLEVTSHRRAASVLHVLRDELIKQKMRPAFVDEFVRRIALNAGIKLG